jgi:hypothetical protein
MKRAFIFKYLLDEFSDLCAGIVLLPFVTFDKVMSTLISVFE